MFRILSIITKWTIWIISSFNFEKKGIITQNIIYKFIIEFSQLSIIQ